MKIIIPLFISLYLLPVNSQEVCNKDISKNATEKGYIVNLDHDTIYGTIKLGSKTGLHKQISLIDDKYIETAYSPEDILSFHFGSTHFIGHCLVYNETWSKHDMYFLQQLNDGYLKLYRFINYQPNVASSIKVVKKEAQYYIGKGDLPPTFIPFYRILPIYTLENPVIDSIMRKREYTVEDLPSILTYYNQWLVKTGKIKEELYRDSVNSNTTINLLEAEKDSILLFRSEDVTMLNYFFRIIIYAINTPGFKGYFIYDQIDLKNRPFNMGLKVNLSNGYNKIGTWRHYYRSDNMDDPLQLKVEEQFNLNSKWHGKITEYTPNGDTKSIRYFLDGNEQ